jgi:glycosyltransferase involved in cell wall biosynthesis
LVIDMSRAASDILTTPALFRRDGADGAQRNATPALAHCPPRPLRVLQIVESSSGGTGRHVIDLCGGLAGRGCDVHLLYSTGRIDRLFAERMAQLVGVRSAPVPMRTSIHPSDFFAARAVRKYVGAHGPFDVVHGHSSKGGAVARLAALGTGAAAFYTLHGLIMMDPDLAGWKRRLYLGIERVLGWGTERIIAVSPEEQRAAAALGLPRVVLIPNGVGPSELLPRGNARSEIGASEGERVVGFVGRFVSQKAPHVLLGAMKRVAKQVPDARLAMVGAGPLEASLRAFARREGLDGRVRWLGERDARTVMAGFDVFAIPSCKEGLPYVVLEAMSAGLPVVATDTAGVESLVTTGVNGVVVPCGDVAALGAALVAVARDRETIARFGAASLRRVARFTVEAMVDRTLAAYRGEPVSDAGVASDVAADELEEAVPV